MELFGKPEKIAEWTRNAIADLALSLRADSQNGRTFAYFTRIRQPEELYYRALYALVVAPAEHLTHIVSGDPPNTLKAIVVEVDNEILGGRNLFESVRVDPSGAQFTVLKTLNQAGHASFAAMLTAFHFGRDSNLFGGIASKYELHLTTLCKNLEYIEGLYKAGRTRGDVLIAIRNLHNPKSYLQHKAPAPTVGET